MYEEKTKSEVFQENVSNGINCGNLNVKEFAQAMNKDHRTLQQGFTKLCIAWLEELATNGSSDLRNESAYKFATKVMTLTTEDERYMPFI